MYSEFVAPWSPLTRGPTRNAIARNIPRSFPSPPLSSGRTSRTLWRGQAPAGVQAQIQTRWPTTLDPRLRGDERESGKRPPNSAHSRASGNPEPQPLPSFRRDERITCDRRRQTARSRPLFGGLIWRTSCR